MQNEKSCKTCKWLEQIPFAGYECECEKSDYYHCECNPKEDICIDYEEKKE